MYDSVNPYAIPLSAPMVAGYVDGAYAWTGDGWNRFAGVPRVRIACFASTFDADVLDVESGCSTIDEAGAWLKAHVDRGEWRVLYFSVGLFGALHASVLAHGVQDGQWGIWQANWDGVYEVPYGSIAKQYAGSDITKHNWDLSAVVDYWPGVDAPPVAAPPPVPGGLDGVRLAWAGLSNLLQSEVPTLSDQVAQLAESLTGLV